MKKKRASILLVTLLGTLAVLVAVVFARLWIRETAPSRPEETQRNPRVSYTIKRGDTLASIAKEFLGSHRRFDEVLELNPHLHYESIKVGMQIWIPAADVSVMSPVLGGP